MNKIKTLLMESQKVFVYTVLSAFTLWILSVIAFLLWLSGIVQL